MFVFFILILVHPGCNNDSITTNNNVNPPVVDSDTSILRTDWLGNVLGGDTTDWCHYGGSNAEFSFSPVYPNPVSDTFTVSFSLPYDTFAKIFFKNNNDTIFVFNQFYNAGYYQLNLTRSQLGYSNQYKRLYMSSDNFQCYGDIKFE